MFSERDVLNRNWSFASFAPVPGLYTFVAMLNFAIQSKRRVLREKLQGKRTIPEPKFPRKFPDGKQPV